MGHLNYMLVGFIQFTMFYVGYCLRTEPVDAMEFPLLAGAINALRVEFPHFNTTICILLLLELGFMNFVTVLIPRYDL